MGMRRNGIGLAEMGIVVAILVILTAILLPQLQQSPMSVKQNHTTFRLQTLRTAIQKYKRIHGAPPQEIQHLLKSEDEVQGPLLESVPVEAFSQSAQVVVVDHEGQLTVPVRRRPVGESNQTQAGGWLYNCRTGEVRVNLEAYRSL